MGYAIGFDGHRDIGYGVPCTCEQPGCDKRIHRGMAYKCMSEDDGCGRYFCTDHLTLNLEDEVTCQACDNGLEPYDRKEDLLIWNWHKLTDASWEPHINRPQLLARVQNQVAAIIRSERDPDACALEIMRSFSYNDI